MAVAAAELASVPLFASLDGEQLDEVARLFEERTVGEGVTLAGEGASGYSFFVIVAGSASVTSSGAKLRTLGPGDFFGEIAILGDGRRSATVTSTTPARLLVMFGTSFRRLQQSHPEIAAELEAAMAERRSA